MRTPRRIVPLLAEVEARVQASIANDPDNPELTHDEIASLRPTREVLAPALHAALTRRPGQRGPGKPLAKIAVTLRLDDDVVEAFKADGAGWQTRMNEAVRKARLG